MKQLGVFLNPPGWDDSPSQVTTQHFVASTHLYSWVERGTESKVSFPRTQQIDPSQGSNLDHSVPSPACYRISRHQKYTIILYKLARTTRAYAGFCSTKPTGRIPTPPGWDASPSQVTRKHLNLSSVPIYTPTWREAL